MIIKADFQKITGTIKPMHAVGQPPMSALDDTLMHYLPEAGIPYSRLHDTQGVMGGSLYVDIPNIFCDFDADVNDPASYEFTFTDEFIKKMIKHNVQPFYRLGVTIENYVGVKAFRIYPPKDFQKWAEICEHIIRHYNEGWADGYTFGIKYWEIWNEPEVCYNKNELSQMWLGTPQQFYDLYAITAKHLKECFGDSIAVGGYANCGFYDCWRIDPNCEGYPGEPTTNYPAFIKFAHEFLAIAQEKQLPLDFFSWHSYANIQDTLDMGRYIRKLLAKYGFQDVPDFLDEWNNCFSLPKRHTQEPAALALGMMLAMQKSDTAMLNYYDARIGRSVYGGMFNPGNWTPYLTYYAFVCFNELYKLKNEVLTESNDEDIQVGGATDGVSKVLVIANQKPSDATVTLKLTGADLRQAEIVLLNNDHVHTKADLAIVNNSFTLPAHTCMELHFK